MQVVRASLTALPPRHLTVVLAHVWSTSSRPLLLLSGAARSDLVAPQRLTGAADQRLDEPADPALESIESAGTTRPALAGLPCQRRLPARSAPCDSWASG